VFSLVCLSVYPISSITQYMMDNFLEEKETVVMMFG